MSLGIAVLPHTTNCMWSFSLGSVTEIFKPIKTSEDPLKVRTDNVPKIARNQCKFTMGFDASTYKYDNYIVEKIDDSIAHLKFNNPKTLNAFGETEWRTYKEILERLDAEEEMKVIVISSTVPKSFSSGLNLKEAMSMMSSGGKKSQEEKYNELLEHIRDFQDAIGAPSTINTPTIALLNGINYGLALDISSACTIRVASAEARFSIREIVVGLPADIGTLQRMPRLVNNISLFNQYALTGEVFSAEEALNLGFVSKVVASHKEGLDYVLDLAETIGGYQQWAIKGTKKSIQDIMLGGTADQGYKWIQKYNAKHLGEKFVEAMGAVKL